MAARLLDIVPMHFSAFVVTTAPRHLASVRRDLDAMPGLEVRHWHEASGRLIVVHEGETLASQEEALRRIQAHRRVLAAGLHYHYLDPAIESDRPGTAGSDRARKGTP